MQGQGGGTEGAAAAGGWTDSRMWGLSHDPYYVRHRATGENQGTRGGARVVVVVVHVWY